APTIPELRDALRPSVRIMGHGPLPQARRARGILTRGSARSFYERRPVRDQRDPITGILTFEKPHRPVRLRAHDVSFGSFRLVATVALIADTARNHLRSGGLL